MPHSHELLERWKPVSFILLAEPSTDEGSRVEKKKNLYSALNFWKDENQWYYSHTVYPLYRTV